MTESNLAFVFPGQGSQKPGMLAEMAAASGLVESTFAEASEVLGYDLWSTCQQGSAEELAQTEVTQPLLLTASTALWRCWQDSKGPQPALLAGHSLGEWSALVAAGVISLADGVRLVQLRGQYMQSAVPAGQGAMAAIVGLEDDLIEKACEEVAGNDVVLPVNFNSPGQVVIAGHASAVDRAAAKCSQLGARRAMQLPVSAPFHTPLMQPAADRLASDIEATSFSAPQIPVLHNVTVAAENDAEEIKRLMVRQITSPVPWTQTLSKMLDAGILSSVECGPGKVLAGLNKRIAKELTTLSIETPEALQSSLGTLQGA